uniref:MADF domain-containing protein n=1 Tax=Heliothis virescens TaxID=7102 RepID=A0A2A4J2G2_HELVI
MAFKYSTRQFIKEMECRPCLWNTNSPEYSDRVAREMAWVEIGKLMYDDWADDDQVDKTEKVRDLQKKWKGLRDYFTRESRMTSSGQRKRRRPFLDMLRFLNDKSAPTKAPANHQPAETNHSKVAKKNSYSSNNENHKYTAPTAAATRQPAIREATELQLLNDPDSNFLLSILPDMKSMNPTQNFEFRFQVMTLIKNIKYSQQEADFYVYCGSSTSNIGNQLQNFKPSNTDQEDPIANDFNSEDRKVIIQHSPDRSPSQ